MVLRYYNQEEKVFVYRLLKVISNMEKENCFLLNMIDMCGH